MGANVFPAPTSSTTSQSNKITVAAAKTLKVPTISLTPGVYTFSCVSSTVTTIEFYTNAGTLITSTATVSGTVTVNLADGADRIHLWTSTGTDVVVTIERIANILTSLVSGTIDTITSSTTYTNTSSSGFAYAVVIGGGGGGGGGATNYGGGAGGIAEKMVALTGSMPIVVGLGGTQNVSGGTTTFAGLTANGGVNGDLSPGSGGTATGGLYNTTGGSASNKIGGTRPAATYSLFNIAAATGGASGNDASDSPPGAGTPGTSGGGGSGYGAGGGGGGNQVGGTGGGPGGSGGGGVVYILRF